MDTPESGRREFLAAGAAAAASALFPAPGAAAEQSLPPKLSTHALDMYSGKQAAGIRIDLYEIDGDERKLVKTVRADQDGRVAEHLLSGAEMKVARYEMVFHVAEYYRTIGVALTEPEFLDVVPVRVAIYDAGSRYHIPLYFSPWSYMTYRGS